MHEPSCKLAVKTRLQKQIVVHRCALFHSDVFRDPYYMSWRIKYIEKQNTQKQNNSNNNIKKSTSSLKKKKSYSC